MKRMTKKEAIKALNRVDTPFVEFFKHGSMQLEFYQPENVDLQQPHERDELYFIVSGSGMFIKNNIPQPFEAGEVIFVPAGMQHRFEDFTDDFSTWVVFYGPTGGEAGV